MAITTSLRAGALALTLLTPLAASAQETDPESGLIIADGWETVKVNCTICHSAKLVTQNSGTRERWTYLIRWMQDTQGLWEFPPELEATILDYLAEHYGPKTDARRAPLTPDLLPPNPYKQAAESG